MKDIGSGLNETDNNLAYFNTPLDRHMSSGIQMAEAEVADPQDEVAHEILKARKEGNTLRQVEILAQHSRTRQRALKNLAKDYDLQYPMVQIRRSEGNRATKRIFESIADHPKLADVHKWVPHFKSQPIPVSMGKQYWRPTQYTDVWYKRV